MTLALLVIAGFALASLPLYLALGGVAIAGFIGEDLSPTIFFAELVRLASNPTLIAIPLFTFAGYILAESRASRRIVNLAEAALWWLPGRLAVVAILVMGLMTAFTGASGVTIIALGGLMLPAMMKSGFSERFSLGLLTSSGSIGLLFPPSLAVILYGVVAETPIDKLYLAGVLPGALMVAGMSAYGVVAGRGLTAQSAEPRMPLSTAFREAAWEIPLPIVVIGGIYGGWTTPAEASVITVVYLLVIELLVTRDITLSDLPGIIGRSSVLIGGILLILGSALALTNYFVYIDLTQTLIDSVRGALQSKWAFLLALNLFLLVIGSLVEVFSAIVVILPLVAPLAKHYGIDPLHLGIIFLANLETGFCAPPVGLNLFLSSFRFGKPILSVYRSVLPFFLLQLILLGLITYIPAITLFPVQLFGGK